MRRLLFPLIAVLLVAGCGGGGDDDSLTVADMAGTYTFSKLTYTDEGVTLTVVPPDISGQMVLNADGTCSADLTIFDSTFSSTGTFTVDDPVVTIGWTDDGSDTGAISDEGRTFSFTAIVDGASGTMEFTRL